MAKVTGPLLSFGASGKIADTLVFSRWKGLKTARSYVIPSNPQSAGQVTQRGYLTDAVALWHGNSVYELDGDDKESWNRYAGVLGPMSGFNAFCKVAMDEYIAGGNPGLVVGNETPGSRVAASFGNGIELLGGDDEDVTIHIGNSLTFFGVTDTETAVAGEATFAGIATGFAAGTRVYYWFDSGTPGTDYSRSGIYTAVLT